MQSGSIKIQQNVSIPQSDVSHVCLLFYHLEGQEIQQNVVISNSTIKEIRNPTKPVAVSRSNVSNVGQLCSKLCFHSLCRIQDCWVPEKDVEEFLTCSIPLKRLPQPTAANLHSSIYQHHRLRKHRRK